MDFKESFNRVLYWLLLNLKLISWPKYFSYIKIKRGKISLKIGLTSLS